MDEVNACEEEVGEDPMVSPEWLWLRLDANSEVLRPKESELEFMVEGEKVCEMAPFGTLLLLPGGSCFSSSSSRIMRETMASVASCSLAPEVMRERRESFCAPSSNVSGVVGFTALLA